MTSRLRLRGCAQALHWRGRARGITHGRPPHRHARHQRRRSPSSSATCCTQRASTRSSLTPASLGPPHLPPTCRASEVFAAAGTSLRRRAARRTTAAKPSNPAADGAAKLVASCIAEGKVDGVLGLGGSAGTTIGTAAMRGPAVRRAQADGQHARQRAGAGSTSASATS